jgi:hypothetical protein
MAGSRKNALLVATPILSAEHQMFVWIPIATITANMFNV